MATTLLDVARLAGVSVSTASRALTGDRGHAVAPGTQERVWAAVRRLNYQPKAATHRLSRRAGGEAARTQRIGLILDRGPSKFTDPFWSGVIEGIDAELARQGLHLAFAFLPDDLGRLHQRALLSHAHVDGLILVGGLTPFGEAIDPRRVVIIGGGDDRVCWEVPLRFDVVLQEKSHAMQAMVDHLVALGHRRIGFLGPAPQTEGRARAFVEAMARHDLPVDPVLCPPIEWAAWTADEAYPLARALLARGHAVDALVCAGDQIAIGAMRAAKEQGYRLPRDLAITGFDNLPFVADLDPPLTTVHCPRAFMGELAVRKLIERIATPSLPPIVQMVPGALVIRASCGAHAGQTAAPVA